MKKRKKVIFSMLRFFNTIKYKLYTVKFHDFWAIKQRLEPAEFFLPPGFLFRDIRDLKNKT